ncbi:hypothetical protein [Psychroserpens sp. NJDZ02]|uniref:hypothetical protein n=1 Tax=Psychroserpens sp. NJDZ02 TaxID=2570561 RepID=UPI0010A76DAE|nr:hypothetical protein [Psychroserpens sp. NJDZ02]QCE40801.1 hypothetical protein E9099_04995 [Psychroserpens sp. NJDZ02]
MKIKLLLAGIAVTVMSCAGTIEEETAKRLCNCATNIAELSKKMEESSASTDIDAYTKAMEGFEKCVDPDGEFTKKVEAMTPEENKAYGDKMKALVTASCPNATKAMGLW